MSARTLGPITIVSEHVPDYTLEVDGNGNKQRVELPGHVSFYLVVDGARVRIGHKAAAGLFADIDRAKAAAPPPAQTPPATPPAQQG